ncbi:MAG: hypothetical protein GY861_23110 [bacterium]|nr:hypothetical protein [bacterium]
MKEQYKALPKSQINAIIQDRTDKMVRRKNSLLMDMNTMESKRNNRLGTAQQEFQLSMQANQQKRQEIMDQYGFMKDIYDREDKYQYAQFQNEMAFDTFVRKAEF